MGFFDFFSNAPSNTQVDTAGSYKLGNEWNQTAKGFLNPNNSFYKTASKGQQQNLMDIYASGNRSRLNQMASQGINSNSLAGVLNQDAARKAADQANQFQSNLYGQGINAAQGFAGIGQQYYGQGMQGDMQNAEMNANWQNSWLGIGGSMLGGALGGGLDLLGGIGNIGQGIGNIFNGGNVMDTASSFFSGGGLPSTPNMQATNQTMNRPKQLDYQTIPRGW